MLRSLVLLTALTLIGGLTPPMAKLAVGDFPPLTAAWLRFGVAALLLFATTRARGGLPRFHRRDWPRLMLIGLVAIPLNQAGFLIGVKWANATHAGLLWALAPILMFWGTLLTGLARFQFRMAAASALAFAGAGLVVVTSVQAPGPSLTLSTGMLAGDALLFLGVLSWIVFSLLSKPLLDKYGPMPTLTVALLIGSLALCPLSLFDLNRLYYDQITWRGWLGWLWITVMTAYVAYLLWFLAIARINLTKVAVATNLAPVITILTGHFALGEELSAWIVAGAVLLLAGIYLAIRPRAMPFQSMAVSPTGAEIHTGRQP